MQAHPIVLRDQVVGHVGELEEGMEPGGGGRLGDLAPHQAPLTLDEELVVRLPGITL